jgi:hypothetical protein
MLKPYVRIFQVEKLEDFVGTFIIHSQNLDLNLTRIEIRELKAAVFFFTLANFYILVYYLRQN